jgi:hypothetical protein
MVGRLWKKTYMKLTNQKPTIKYLDSLWSQLVKLKAGNKCEVCGKTEYLNSHHIFSRSNRAMRFDDRNGAALCPNHHVLGNWSAHKSPIEFIEWLKEKRGVKWYKEIRLRAGTVSKVDMKLTKIYLINEIKKFSK